MKSDINALEADGIKLIDFEAPDDLRMSIEPKRQETNETGKFQNNESLLMLELERVKSERDELKRQKEHMAREHLN